MTNKNSILKDLVSILASSRSEEEIRELQSAFFSVYASMSRPEQVEISLQFSPEAA